MAGRQVGRTAYLARNLVPIRTALFGGFLRPQAGKHSAEGFSLQRQPAVAHFPGAISVACGGFRQVHLCEALSSHLATFQVGTIIRWPFVVHQGGQSPFRPGLHRVRYCDQPIQHHLEMTHEAIRIAVLGSTGSIGQSAVEVIASSGGRLQAVALAAHRNVALLRRQVEQLRPRWAVVVDPQAAEQASGLPWPKGTELLAGPEGLLRAATAQQVDTVLSAVVGRAGLEGTWAAVEAGKTVALANKESLVVAGQLVSQLAAESGARILPVDSEHSAIFQALQSGRAAELRRVILTASGGPFRTWSLDELSRVTVAEALAHPTWRMGEKITIDSATLMNKALEIIEARWLFDLRPEQIGVVIHPQSIVHSLVEFVDGSVIAQLSCPDMRLPIQYALSWPYRWQSVAEKLDWSTSMQLDFHPPDMERFAALRLGLEVARTGGTAGAVLNAANEAAVEAFLRGDLRFHEIVPACESVLANHPYSAAPALEELLKLDHWAREEINRWVCT